MIEAERDRDLQLIPDPVALFERELVRDARRSLYIDTGSDQRFVFGKRLLGVQREGKIHLTTRPPFLLTEAAQGLDDHVHLFGCQRVSKRWHDLREGSFGPAVPDHR